MEVGCFDAVVGRGNVVVEVDQEVAEYINLQLRLFEPVEGQAAVARQSCAAEAPVVVGDEHFGRVQALVGTLKQRA